MPPHSRTPAAAAGDVYPITLLVEEMKSEDTEARIVAMRKLRVVAAALGPERTRRELVPFLNGAQRAGCARVAAVAAMHAMGRRTAAMARGHRLAGA